MKGHVINPKLNEDVKFTQQKDRCLPNQLQDEVQKQISLLLNKKLFETVSAGIIKVSNQLTILTVKNTGVWEVNQTREN